MNDEWDQEDEHRRADFDHLLDRMRRDHEERSIGAAETALGRVSSFDLPMPNTAHPGLTRYASAVRSARVDHVRIPVARSLTAYLTDAPEPAALAPTAALLLTKRRCVGPAPFVGDPRRFRGLYTWFSWTDDYGRHIGGDAELVIERVEP